MESANKKRDVDGTIIGRKNTFVIIGEVGEWVVRFNFVFVN